MTLCAYQLAVNIARVLNIPIGCSLSSWSVELVISSSPTVVGVSATKPKSVCAPACLLDALILKISPLTVSRFMIRSFANDNILLVISVELSLIKL